MTTAPRKPYICAVVEYISDSGLLPAVITFVHTNGSVDLHVLSRDNDGHPPWNHKVMHDRMRVGSWRWPEQPDAPSVVPPWDESNNREKTFGTAAERRAYLVGLYDGWISRGG